MREKALEKSHDDVEARTEPQAHRASTGFAKRRPRMSNEQDKLDLIFSEALAKGSEDERQRYLAQACGADVELRGQVDSLLAAHAAAGDFLKQSVISPSGGQIGEGPGSVIGRYKLLQQIGEGGFGVIFMAEQQEPVRRMVALKILKAGMDTKEVVARFEAERQALALMDHPNIARVLDGGATAGGRPYFVMDLVKGVPITEFCDQRRMPTQARLQLFMKVCAGVQHAHQKGIIHRDLKPTNVLVTLHDGEAVPKVIDFGVAKAIGQKLTERTLFTRFEQLIGTPAYMSPEQAEWSGLDIDTRSDIYALGVLLYELLTSTTPLEKETLARAGLEEVRRLIRETEPPKPSTRLQALGQRLEEIAHRRHIEPGTLTRLVRGELDWIVVKCLEKDRTRRYETASELALDIQRHLENEPVTARPPSALYRFQKLARRYRTAFTAAAMFAVVLVATTAVSVWQAVRASRAELQAKERLAESEAISTFLTEVFQSPDPARDGRTITVAETLDKAVKKLNLNMTNQPGRRARLQATLARTYEALGLFRQAIPLQETVRQYDLAALGPEHHDTLKVTEDLANTYGDAGRHNEALKLQEETLALRRKVLGPEHPDTLKTMINLANSYFDLGRRREALKLREETLALSRKVNGPEHPDTLKAMQNLATSYFAAGRRPEAVKLEEETLALRRKVNGPEHPATLMAMNNLATSYFDLGRREEALKLWEEELPLSRKVNGPEHADTIRSMNNLAYSYADAGRQAEALKLREEVLALSRKVLGPEHAQTLAAMANAASSYFDLGRREEALKLRQETLALSRTALGPEHPDTIEAMAGLAFSYFELGRREEALKLQQETLELSRKVNGSEHPETIVIMNNLADSYARSEQWSKAVAEFSKLVELQPNNYLFYHSLAPLLVQSGDLEGYRRHCAQALARFGNTNDPIVAETMAKDCLILPGAEAELEAIAKLADTAVTRGKSHESFAFCEFAKGLAEYRQGHFAGAIEWMQKVLAQPGETYRDPQAHLVLAMALHNSGKDTEARASLAEGARMIETGLPKLESGDIGRHWIDWIITHALLKEAQDLIEGHPLKE